MTILFLFSILAFCAFFPLHALVLRLSSGTCFVRNSFLCLLAVVIGFGILWISSPLVFAYFAFQVASIWIVYMLFLINLQNSVSLHLMQIAKDQGGAFPTKVFEDFFATTDSIRDRIELLRSKNLIRIENGAITLTSKGAFLAHGATFFQNFIGLKNCG